MGNYPPGGTREAPVILLFYREPARRSPPAPPRPGPPGVAEMARKHHETCHKWHQNRSWNGHYFAANNPLEREGSESPGSQGGRGRSRPWQAPYTGTLVLGVVGPCRNSSPFLECADLKPIPPSLAAEAPHSRRTGAGRRRRSDRGSPPTAHSGGTGPCPEWRRRYSWGSSKAASSAGGRGAMVGEQPHSPPSRAGQSPSW